MKKLDYSTFSRDELVQELENSTRIILGLADNIAKLRDTASEIASETYDMLPNGLKVKE